MARPTPPFPIPNSETFYCDYFGVGTFLKADVMFTIQGPAMLIHGSEGQMMVADLKRCTAFTMDETSRVLQMETTTAFAGVLSTNLAMAFDEDEHLMEVSKDALDSAMRMRLCSDQNIDKMAGLLRGLGYEAKAAPADFVNKTFPELKEKKTKKKSKKNKGKGTSDVSGGKQDAVPEMPQEEAKDADGGDTDGTLQVVGT